MKKLLFILFLLPFVVLSQVDTTKSISLNTEISISTRNVWRGVNYGNNSPSVGGSLGLNYKDVFEIGAFGTATLGGTKSGYGNWLELYATYTHNNWSLTLDDYYFFSYDSLNDYLNWSSTNTQHLLEARLKYDHEKFNIVASYNIYASKNAAKAFYFEAEYFIIPELSLLFGALTGESWLNCHDAGGITAIGVAGYRDIDLTKTFTVPLKTLLVFNPNYKNISQYEGLGRNPVNFLLTITF